MLFSTGHHWKLSYNLHHLSNFKSKRYYVRRSELQRKGKSSNGLPCRYKNGVLRHIFFVHQNGSRNHYANQKSF